MFFCAFSPRAALGPCGRPPSLALGYCRVIPTGFQFGSRPHSTAGAAGQGDVFGR